MKGFSYYVMNAIVTQFVNHFDYRTFSNSVASHISENTGEIVTVTESRKSGMILRTKRDSAISVKSVKEGIINAMQDLIENDTDDFEVDIVEKYEFEFGTNQIDIDFINETMDIKKKGKDIYIEIDI